MSAGEIVGASSKTKPIKRNSDHNGATGSGGGGGGGGGRNVRKRVMANERERERTKSLNSALEVLRRKLPCTEAEKRSKIQTLRTAKEYIEFLVAYKEELQQHQHPHQQIHSEESIAHDNQSNSGEYDEMAHIHQQFNQVKITNIINSLQPHSPSPSQPHSALSYKFYKFRLSRRRIDKPKPDLEL